MPKLIIHGFYFAEGSGHMNLEKYMYLILKHAFSEACKALCHLEA